MSEFLVVYSTGEGQTRKIAEFVVTTLEADGHTARAVDVAAPPDDLDPDAYDAIVVGGSIHVGRHSPALVEFVCEHRDVLGERPGAFFQVCLSAAADDPERRAEADRYAAEFQETTGWTPNRVAVFAGALRYSEYGLLKRLVMKRIARGATGDTDTSRDYEYTDWDAVTAFTTEFIDTVVARSQGIVVD